MQCGCIYSYTALLCEIISLIRLLAYCHASYQNGYQRVISPGQMVTKQQIPTPDCAGSGGHLWGSSQPQVTTNTTARGLNRTTQAPTTP